MKALKLLGEAACLRVLLGTGVLPEILEGEPGASTNPKDNVHENTQRNDPHLSGDDSSYDSDPESRSGKLTG